MATEVPANQNSGPTRNDEQTISFFIRFSQYTRYQLNEFLPSLISKSHPVITEEMLGECDALLSSVKTFIQLMKGGPSKLEEVKSDFGDVKEMWKRVIIELHSSVNCSTGKSEKKGYYCGLCNYCTFCVEEWNNHLKSDKIHSERNNFSSNENMNVQGYHCTVCGLLLYSENTHLNIILNSKDHQNLDDYVKSLKIKAQAPHPLTKNMDKASNSLHNICVAKQKINKKIEAEHFSGQSSNNNENIRTKNSSSKSNEKQNKDNTENQEKKDIPQFNNSNGEEKSGKMKICNKFVIFCENVRSKKWNECYYCKPCNKIFEDKQKWKNHVDTLKHTKNDVMIVCDVCRSGIFIFRHLAKDYMSYHMQKCHPDLSQASTSNFCLEN